MKQGHRAKDTTHSVLPVGTCGRKAQSEKQESQEKAGKKGLPGSGVLGRQAKVGIVKTVGSPVPENQRGEYEQKSDYSPEDVPEGQRAGRGEPKQKNDNVKGEEDESGQGGSAGQADLPGISAGQGQG